MTLIISARFIEAATKLSVPLTLNSKILILATQVHAAEKPPSERKCCTSEPALALAVAFFGSLTRKDAKGANLLRSLLYFTICSTTKFIPLEVDLELSMYSPRSE